MKTKHFILTAIGAFALMSNVSANQSELLSGEVIQAPQSMNTTSSDDVDKLVHKLYDYEQARIQREKTYLAQIKFEDIQMTDGAGRKDSRLSRLSPSAPAHPASE